MEDIHKIENPFKKRRVVPQIRKLNYDPVQPFNYGSPQEPMQFTNYDPVQPFIYGSPQEPLPFTPLEKTWISISKILKASGEYMKFSNIVQQNNYLRRQIDFHQREVHELRTKNWIIPHSAIEGLSGNICPRCSTFSFVYIQHVGYDKTMQIIHACNDENVQVAKDPSKAHGSEIQERWRQHISAVSRMLDELNFIMPGKKYLIAEDKTQWFDFVENLMDPFQARTLLGIPDRFYYHIVTRDMMSDWINRVVANMGQKVNVEDFEVMDLLSRVMSTYAIFAIPHDEGIKKVLITITR